MGTQPYLADFKRPDLTYIVGIMGNALSKPTLRHYNMMTATLRNLTLTSKNELHFHRDNYNNKNRTYIKISPIIAISDAYWANDKVDRKLVTGGYMTQYGIPIDWRSRNQNAVSISTPDAEYRAMAQIIQKAVYVQQLLKSFKTK